MTENTHFIMFYWDTQTQVLKMFHLEQDCYNLVSNIIPQFPLLHVLSVFAVFYNVKIT